MYITSRQLSSDFFYMKIAHRIGEFSDNIRSVTPNDRPIDLDIPRNPIFVLITPLFEKFLTSIFFLAHSWTRESREMTSSMRGGLSPGPTTRTCDLNSPAARPLLLTNLFQRAWFPFLFCPFFNQRNYIVGILPRKPFSSFSLLEIFPLDSITSR
jgi:hypothetical protein